MKRKQVIFAVAILALIFAYSCKSSSRLTEEQKQAVTTRLTENNYTFIATSANPMSGRNIQLTSSYYLKVTPDTVSAHLPFFGRAYSATLASLDNGSITFTSTNFEYQSEQNKKGEWDINIKIKGDPKAYQLRLSVSDSGMSILNITQANKQPMTYYGRIE